jgi:hypothetical protein
MSKREWCEKHQAFHRCEFDKKQRIIEAGKKSRIKKLIK